VWGFGAALDRKATVVLIGSVQATDEENQTMAENMSMALAELLRKADAEPGCPAKFWRTR